MMGSIAKAMMQKAVRIAGDGAKMVEIKLFGIATYDPATGKSVKTEEIVPIGRGIVSRITEEDVARFNLTKTTHKVVVAYADYEKNGAPELPTPEDRVTIAGKEWLIDKVVIGSMDQSIKFFVCEP